MHHSMAVKCTTQLGAASPVVSDDSSRPAPAVRPLVLTPLNRLPAAMWAATREEEQAVSTLTAGPLKAKV